jgi:hypothetical protein
LAYILLWNLTVRAIMPRQHKEDVMIRFQTLLLAIAALCVFSVSSHAARTYSGHALNESGAASAHSGASVANSIAATGQVVSAVAAVPFYAVEAVGQVGGAIAEGLHDVATAPASRPLEITDEVLTTGRPPDEALKTAP